MLQLGGWLVYSIAVAVTSVPVRNQHDFIAYRIMYVASGFLGSFVIYWVCHSLLKRGLGLLASLAWCTPVCLVIGLLCSVASVWTEEQVAVPKRAFHLSLALPGTTGSSFVFLAWAAIYFGIKHYQALEQHRFELVQAVSLARDAQLRALRYQLQPHFLFNTLNAISMLVLDDRKHDATRMIARLADLLRNTIDAPDTHLVSLGEELLLVEQYLTIEQVRFGERLRTKIDIAHETLQAIVPRLLLQPLVENAIRHGIAPLLEGGTLTIASNIEADRLCVRVGNDVEESESDSLNKKGRKGVGLANTRARLQQLYGSNQQLETHRLKTGVFEVSIAIPLEYSSSIAQPQDGAEHAL